MVVVDGDLKLPNVPGQAPYPVGPPGAYNIPPGMHNYAPSGPPPPPDPSADAGPLPDKISNNFQNVSGAGSGTGQWDELMGIDNSPPPPYSSYIPSGHSHNMVPPPNAPPPSVPGNARPHFPPDVGPGAGNLKNDDQPKPAPRSKFGDGSPDFAMPDLPSVPDLPNVPGGNTLPDPNDTKDDIDFDDLTKRFEELKKKK
ncbi:hypothetical protein SK128_014799 [Halocaridina rubra]|uniref:IST1 homolog n=1 Tax=Halocaridina rubra TaxID=373956 RepID=A0AAN9AGB5_HALRR